MKIKHRTLTSVTLVASLLGLASCSRKETPAPAPKSDQPTATTQPMPSAGHMSVIPLGQSDIGPYRVLATRDQGDIVPGKDAPIDVTVTPRSEGAPKVRAVRFWIGLEDARGSVKAKAAVENPAEPDRWHTHAEIPATIPADSKLWVEIEDDQSATHIGAFGLTPTP